MHVAILALVASPAQSGHVDPFAIGAHGDVRLAGKRRHGCFWRSEKAAHERFASRGAVGPQAKQPADVAMATRGKQADLAGRRRHAGGAGNEAERFGGSVVVQDGHVAAAGRRWAGTPWLGVGQRPLGDADLVKLVGVPRIDRLASSA